MNNKPTHEPYKTGTILKDGTVYIGRTDQNKNNIVGRKVEVYLLRDEGL